MTSFLCDRCGYETPHKKNFKQHLTRKSECKPQTEQSPSMQEVKDKHKSIFVRAGSFVCDGCDKTFISYHSRYVHKKNYCKNNTVTKLMQELQTLKERLQQREQQEQTQPVPSTSTTNNTTNNIYNNNNTTNNIIVLNKFGEEDTSHLTSSFLDRCLKRTNKGVLELISKIHFDADKPENNNLRIPNKKLYYPFIQKWNGEHWHYEKKDTILNDLVEKSQSLLNEHWEENGGNLSTTLSVSMLEHIKQWIINMEQHDKQTYEPLITDVFLLILNNS